MRSVNTIVNRVRLLTDNENYNDISGIQTNEILEHINDAQDRIYSLIQKAHDNVFLETSEVSIAAGQKEVTIPTAAYLGLRVVKVEFKTTGSGDYQILKQGNISEEMTGNGGYPSFYVRYGNYITLNPKTDRAATLRWTYQKAMPRLDVPRGTVSAVTLGTNTITSLTLDPTLLDPDNVTDLIDNGYMSVSANRTGVVKMKSIPVDNVNETTGLVTIDSSFTFDDGETIEVGDKVTSGAFSTVTSQLPINVERYFKTYCGWKLLRRDSNSESLEQTQELVAMEQDIVSSFAEADMDVEYPAILDTQFLASEWY
jgi:hypothetical protein